MIHPHLLIRAPLVLWFTCLVFLTGVSGQTPRTPALNKDPENTESRTKGFLTPERSLAALKLPPGFQASLFAAEPDVRQPIAAATDGRGRLWVCENFTYSEAKVNFDLSQADRIVIFEDRDQDGKSDSHKVFWDRGKRLTSIALGFDGVYAACAPNLLFIPDRNHDDIPDGPAEILLDGWNDDSVRHNIVNGLMWGPDGWLYGRHGIMATSFVGAPGSTASQRTPINCGVWRYHPLHKKFEVVAHGTTNPWGMDFNNEGDLFMINTVIGHLWHVVPGARYERMYGAHFNPYTYRTIQQTADHFHWNKSGGEAWHATKKIGVTDETDRFGGGHAHCGMMFYGDDYWPEDFRNTVLTCNLHGLRINNDRLVKQGNGYTGKHNPDFLRTTDTWFRGIELVRSHDQGFYLLDWQDTGECHENDGVHRTSGRIYKITFGQKSFAKPDLARQSDKEILKSLPQSRWHLQHGALELRTRLARKAGQSGRVDKSSLQSLLEHDDRSFEQRLLRQSLASDWGNSAVYGAEQVLQWQDRLQQYSAGKKMSRSTTKDLENHVLEMLQVLANESALKNQEASPAPWLLHYAKKAGPSVRLAMASYLHRLTSQSRMALAKILLQFGEDEHDNLQPLLIWYAVEPLICESPDEALELAVHSQIPVVTELIARRLTEEITSPRIGSAVVKLLQQVRPESRSHVLAGMGQALRGRKKLSAPAGWKQVVDSFELTPEQSELLQPIRIVFGDGQTLEQLRKMAGNRNADPRMRGQAIMTLAESNADGLLKLLNQNFGDREVQQYVIEAYAYCDENEVAGKIINQFSRLKPTGKAAAIDTLAKRSSWSAKLLEAIQRKQIPQTFLTAWHARQIANMNEPELNRRLEDVWGTLRQTPEETQRQMNALKKLVEGVKATEDVINEGAMIFRKSCANCHVLYGEGEKIGPDLTGSNRRDIGYLLENILDPSSSVADSYRSSLIALKDGRTITGVILNETVATLEIQTAEKKFLVDRQEVERIKPTKNSLMPEGLLNTLTDRQKKSLLIYLMQR